MDAMEEQLNQYKQDAINTATPDQLTLMLYRAALTGVRAFRDTLRDNPSDTLTASQLPRDILVGLAENVNPDHPHSQTMKDLYLFCWRALLESSTSRSPEGLDTVVSILENLIAGLEEYTGRRRVPVATTVSEEPVSINFAG
jgi:flagellar protein FliS